MKHIDSRWWIALVVLALLPSGILCWQWRSMPQLGIFHDDGIYYLGAKSLAEGHGYRIESLPWRPFQTKYPPVISAWLSLAWLGGGFPENLKWATLLCWLPLLLWVATAWFFFRQCGLSRAVSAALCAAVALHPTGVEDSLTPMSDVLFAGLLMAATILSQRALLGSSVAPAAASGLVAGIGFLTRTAGVAFLASAAACLAWQRRWRQAAVFILTGTPFLLGWHIWVAAHRDGSGHPVSLYYTDYVGFQRALVPWPDLLGHMGMNAQALLGSLSELLLGPWEGIAGVTAARIVVCAAAAGMVRMARRGYLQGPCFAALAVVQLSVHWYTPEPRFLLCILPILYCGLWFELRQIAALIGSAVRRPGLAERSIGVVMAVLLLACGVSIAARDWKGLSADIPAAYSGNGNRLAASRGALEWIRLNTAPTARVFAFQDPLAYLSTQRSSFAPRLAHRLKDLQQNVGPKTFDDQLQPFSKEPFRADYVLLTTFDLGGRSNPDSLAEFIRRFARPGRLEPVYQDRQALVLKTLPASMREAGAGSSPQGQRLRAAGPLR